MCSSMVEHSPGLREVRGSNPGTTDQCFFSYTTVIVRAGGAIWLNPFATVLFSVCSAATVECCALYPCCMGVFSMFAVM